MSFNNLAAQALAKSGIFISQGRAEQRDSGTRPVLNYVFKYVVTERWHEGLYYVKNCVILLYFASNSVRLKKPIASKVPGAN